MLPLIKRIINALLFYFGWWFCMHEAVGDHPYNGSLMVLAILIYNLIISSMPKSDLILIISFAFIGLIVDTLYIQVGMIHYEGGYRIFPNIAPLWIISLWALYASSINHSLDWLRHSNLFAAAMGAAGAISSYAVGIKLESATFLWSATWGYAVIGVVWALVVPLSIYYSQWLQRWLNEYPSKGVSKV